jgi:hypothetical protein
MAAVRIAVLAAAVVALAGCGSSGNDDPSQPPASAGTPIPGGGLTIQEAIDSDLDGPLMVRGYLIERDGELRLCEAILESFPPQCGEPSLRVDGSAPSASEELVSLLGDVEDGTITVSETAIG